ERLTPAERAVLLLHDVFDFSHEQIAPLLERTPAACRKLLERARKHVAAGRRMITASREEHARLLEAFVRAAAAGDVDGLVALLAADAQMITDGGPGGRSVGGFRNLVKPLDGARQIAAFVVATARSAAPTYEMRELNGKPAVVFFRDGALLAALL